MTDLTKYSSKFLKDLCCFDCKHMKGNVVQLCGKRRLCVECCQERQNDNKKCPICLSALDEDHCTPDHFVRKTVQKLLQNHTEDEVKEYMEALPPEQELPDEKVATSTEIRQDDRTPVECTDSSGTNLDVTLQNFVQQCMDLEEQYREIKQQELHAIDAHEKTTRKLSDMQKNMVSDRKTIDSEE